MNKRYKAKWIKALRSGKYEQGSGSLYNPYNNSFCCLGVLHECITGRKPRRNSVFLSDAIADKASIERVHNSADTIQDKLSCMNDRGDSFSKISNWIEKNL
jgi:hypothetical protein